MAELQRDVRKMDLAADINTLYRDPTSITNRIGSTEAAVTQCDSAPGCDFRSGIKLLRLPDISGKNVPGHVLDPEPLCNHAITVREHLQGDRMLRIEFNPHDLARVRLLAANTPITETLFATHMLGSKGGGKPFERWRRTTRRQMGSLADPPWPPSQSLRFTPELFTQRASTFNGSEDSFMESCDVSADVATAIHRFYHVAVAPYWTRMQSYLEAERASRGAIALSAGIEGLLSTLDPLARWKPPILEISTPRPRTVRLDGRGLLIVPSLFHAGRPDIVVPDEPSPRSSPVLVYPAPFNVADAKTLWNLNSSKERVLNALIGRTRAGVLRALSESHTTTGLSRRLGVSPAAVSQHTSILREAGLIITRRRRNTVWHSLTPLGQILIDGGADQDLAPPGAGQYPALRAVNKVG